MRDIKYIVLHCTGANPNQTTDSILKYWKNINGWKDPGYHYIISVDGKIEKLHPIEKPSNGVKGYNSNSIHICYKGGENGKDTRTAEQKASMEIIVLNLNKLFPKAEIKGHRDFPGVTKLCPSFDVKTWLKEIGI